jgi:hypothetical protein
MASVIVVMIIFVLLALAIWCFTSSSRPSLPL